MRRAHRCVSETLADDVAAGVPTQAEVDALSVLPDVAAAPASGAAAAGGAAAGPPASAPTAFAPTHRVPPEGMPSWPIPNPAGPSTPLSGGLDLEIVQRIAGWAQVRASNGWLGWVDGRRLVVRTPRAT